MARGQYGETHPNWKGGRQRTREGYWLVWQSSGKYVPEHRLVMARLLSRELLPAEQIHHINGDKGDNRIENLELIGLKEHVRRHCAEGRPLKNRKADCHPDREHCAHGLCERCYYRERYKDAGTRYCNRAAPICHPDRPYGGRGMCTSCYHAWYRKVRGSSTQPVRRRGVPTCHPDREYAAKGLCKRCYGLRWQRQKQAKLSTS